MNKETGWLITSMNPFINMSNYPSLEALLAEIWNLPRNVTIDAEKVAKELGSVKAANIVVLGAASPYLEIKFENLEKAIESIFAEKGNDMIQLNLKALRAGKELADKRC